MTPEVWSRIAEHPRSRRGFDSPTTWESDFAVSTEDPRGACRMLSVEEVRGSWAALSNFAAWCALSACDPELPAAREWLLSASTHVRELAAALEAAVREYEGERT